MVDFSGRTVGIMQDAEEFGRYLGGVDQRRQQRWADKELRLERDRAHRYSRAEAQSAAAARGQRQSIAAGIDEDFANFRASGPLNLTAPGPVATGGAAAVTGTTGAASAANQAATPLPAGRVSGLQPSNLPEHNRRIYAPADPDSLNEEERAAVAAYARVAGQTVDTSSPYMARPRVGQLPQSGPQVEEARNRLRALGLDFRNGQLVRTAGVNTPESMQFSTLFEEGTNAEQPAATQQTGASTTAGITGEQSAASQQFWPGQDTSRGLVPTPEMRLAREAIDDQLRRAEVASRHGRNDIADQAFALALQGEATYLQQANTAALMAAGSGNIQAAEWLVERINGYPADTVRIEPTEGMEGYYSFFTLNEAGEWRAAPGAPMTMNDIYSGLNNIVDREGAAARREASMELQRTLIEGQVDLQEAEMDMQENFLDNATQLSIAQLDNNTRERIARGEAQMYIDSASGTAYFILPDVDENGETYPHISALREEEVNVPDTNGRETTRQIVPRSVNINRNRTTGTVGTRAGQ